MSISFDRAAEVFDRTRCFPLCVMNKILEVLKGELEECRRILDVAVGTGMYAKPLQDAGFMVVGVDISKKMLGKAYEKETKDLVVGDACILPFQDSTFDASISVSTLHLIKDWKSALQEITRVTKESLFTILREGLDYETTPSGVYRELLKKYGYAYSHPGLGLGELKEKMKPTKSRFVTSYQISTNESIALLSEKVFSYQWNTPHNLHQKAIKELKRIFAGKKVCTCDVYVHKWGISEIKNYLES